MDNAVEMIIVDRLDEDFYMDMLSQMADVWQNATYSKPSEVWVQLIEVFEDCKTN